jgi:predicted TIM-barrel fold metal-dependent hydrolase
LARRCSRTHASDFPHEGLAADQSRREIDEILEREDLSDDAKRAVLGENARRFYNLPRAS